LLKKRRGGKRLYEEAAREKRSRAIITSAAKATAILDLRWESLSSRSDSSESIEEPTEVKLLAG